MGACNATYICITELSVQIDEMEGKRFRMEKHIFIVNPAAGKYDRTEECRRLVAETFVPRGLPYEILVSQAPGECRALARRAAETGEQVRLYACGGDGTLNEVINGIVGFPNAAVTHFPAGSGNDTIKLFSEPAAFTSLERLLDAEETRFDLIRCNDIYAINILSIGVDARVAEGMTRYKHIPFLSGKGAYILSVVSNLLRGLTAEYSLTLESGERIDGPKTMICVCNGRWYGGGFNPVPDAEPDDGLLDVLIVKDVTLFQAATVIGAYQKGKYRQLQTLIRHERCRSITISCAEQSVVNVDGEALYTQQAKIDLLPQAVRFFYPRGLTWHAKN